MSRSRKSRRPAARLPYGTGSVRGARGRRLCVETMEARLMLSTTPVEIAPLWQGTYAGQSIGPLTVVEGQTLRNLAGQDGYVLFDLTAASDDGDIARFNGVLPSTASYFNQVDPRGHYFSDSDSTLSDLSGFGTGGVLGPIVIPFPHEGEMNTTVTAPPLITPRESIGSAEGGALPIHAVLAGVRAESLAARTQAAPVVASRHPVGDTRLPAVEAVPVSRLSGEWGRAMVFSVAGGERGADEPTANVRSARLRVGETSSPGEGPLSMVDEHGGETTATSAGDDAPGVRPTGDSPPPTEALRPYQSAEFLPDGGSGLSIVLASSRAEARLNVSPAGSVGFVDPSQMARLAAFEQFGDDEAVRVESSTDAVSWRSWGVAPLLLAIALERIAARRFRVPQKEVPRMLVPPEKNDPKK